MLGPGLCLPLETHHENICIARTKFLSALVPLKCNCGFPAYAFDLNSGKEGRVKSFAQPDRRLCISSVRRVLIEKPRGSDVGCRE